jgi:cyclic pyranopterin monophosphate synthase
VTRLSHIDATGRAAMVDIGAKEETSRVAIATGTVTMQAATLALIEANAVTKGDVIATARIAGIMAAKQTSTLILLCHPVALSSVGLEFRFEAEPPAVTIEATARLTGRTGVEMEALTAVSVAALTIYDMCKAADRGMTITGIRLLHKSGGKSGRWDAQR